MANALAVCVDSLHLPGIVGSVAGDDTILLVIKNCELALKLEAELKESFLSALSASSPVAIRYPRGIAPLRKDVGCSVSDGPCKVCMLAVGDQVQKALRVKELLASSGISSEVVPVMKVKPSDVRRSGNSLLVSLENGVVCGGFGEGIGADLTFGWPDTAVSHGTVDELEHEHDFDAQSVASAIRHRLAEK
jgi:1-deoxy-D-xylulose-5-phosphate synthase